MKVRVIVEHNMNDCKIINPNTTDTDNEKKLKYSNKEDNIIALWAKLCYFLKVNNLWVYVIMMMKYEKAVAQPAITLSDFHLST